MLALIITFAVLGLYGDERTATPAQGPTTTVRMIDLDGDQALDRLELGFDGSIHLSLNRGHRQFEPITQSLPSTVVAGVLAEDLNGDGDTDLYLVSPGANVALLGDGSGRLVDATLELGLEDSGVGTSAELVDIDRDGLADVLLHNTTGDVIFWAGGAGTFERDPSTPVAPVDAGPASRVLSILPGGPPQPAAGSPGAIAVASSSDRDRASGVSASGTSRPIIAAPGAPAPRTVPTVPIPPGTLEPAIPIPFCALQIRDVTTGNCLNADSTPTFGRLYPLGPEFNIDSTGSLRQALARGGLVKAVCHIDGTGAVPTVTRQFNGLPNGAGITVIRLAPGQYSVDFGNANLSGRYYFATVGHAGNLTSGPAQIDTALRAADDTALFVRTTDDTTGVATDFDFYLAIF